jgi:adenylate kinase family enzyme
MPVKLFILGRPGAGKSYAARYIAGYLEKRDNSSIHINDYHFLYDQFREDASKQNKRFHRDEHDGFVIDDIKVLDEALEYIKRNAIEHLEAELYDLLIIEFARSDYGTALQTFDPEFLRDTYFLFIESDVEICIKRLNKRIIGRKFSDDHHISEEVIRKFYTKDNRLYMLVGLLEDYQLDSRQVKIVDNMGSIEDFELTITDFINYLIALEKEDSKLRETDPIRITVARPNPEITK